MINNKLWILKDCTFQYRWHWENPRRPPTVNIRRATVQSSSVWLTFRQPTWCQSICTVESWAAMMRPLPFVMIPRDESTWFLDRGAFEACWVISTKREQVYFFEYCTDWEKQKFDRVLDWFSLLETVGVMVKMVVVSKCMKEESNY